MAMDCNDIGSIVINGNNYGATLYDIKIDIGFNTSSVFVASFVNSSGNYKTPSLNAEVPTVLSITQKNGENYKFNVYPVNWKYQVSAAGRLLVVKFVDASHRYLDKHTVVMTDSERKKVRGFSKYFGEKRFLHVVPISTDDSQVELGKYLPYDLLQQMKGKIPMTQRVVGLLEKFRGTKKGIKYEENATMSGMYIDTVGSLREVLNAFGSQIGYTFYWDWSNSGSMDGALDVVTFTSREDADSFAASIKSSYKKFITNYEVSNSIEDNSADIDVVYQTDGGEGTEGKMVSVKNMLFVPINIARDGFWLKPELNRTYFSGEELIEKSRIYVDSDGDVKENDTTKNIDWLKMCAAAMKSKEFFLSYVNWTIGAKIMSNKTLQNFRYRDAEEKASLSIPDPPKGGYNEFLIKLIESFYRGYFVFSRDKDKTIRELVDELETANSPSRKEFASMLMDKAYGTPKSEIIKTFGEKGSADFGDLTPKTFCQVIIEKHPKFNEIIDSLYDTCLTFGKNYNRYMIYSSRKSKTAYSRIIAGMRIYSFKAATTVSKNDYDGYEMKDADWYWEDQDSAETNFADLVAYSKQPHFSETDFGEQTQKPKYKEFLEKFRLTDGGLDMEEYVAEKKKDEQFRDSFARKLRGYVVMDWTGERKVSITDDMNVLILGDDYESKLAFLFRPDGSQKPFETYLFHSESLIETSLKEACKMFAAPKNSRVPRTYRKTTEFSGVSFFNWDWQAAWQNQSHSLTMANNIEFSKVPEVEGYKFDVDGWMDMLKAHKWVKVQQPNVSYNFTIEDLVVPRRGWIAAGIESLSISYNGSGVTTTIAIGTRKKQRQFLENQERLIRHYAEGLNLKFLKRIKPSAARASVQYGMKAYS